jgi:hypothetical protein
VVGFLLVAACASAAPSPGEIDGPCEASALLADGNGWLVGDNEVADRLFRFDAAWRPRGTVALADPIEDIEALATDGTRILVVGSHSARKDGRRDPRRQRFAFLGQPSFQPDLRGLGLGEIAPNIEGAAHHLGHWWIGLRAPLATGGKAILADLGADARAVLSTREVDLGGRGVRDLGSDGGRLWILAGPSAGGEAPHRLYTLEATGVLEDTRREVAAGAEGLAVAATGKAVVVTDGSGKPGACKEPARWAEVP